MTKDVPFVVPLPRRTASRPVAWIADTMALGAAVPSTSTSWSLRFASTLWIPSLSHQLVVTSSARFIVLINTLELVERVRYVFYASLAGHWDREGRLQWR